MRGKRMSAHAKSESLTPREIIGSPNFVTVLGHSTGSLMPSGGRFDDEWAHMFRIRNGKVIEFREYLNTHALVQAYFGGDIHSVTIASEQTARLHH
jgi:ketosteroid isomerase-like protein